MFNRKSGIAGLLDNKNSKEDRMNAVLNFITKTSDKFWLLKLYRYYIIDSIIITKKYGFKELLKRRGWKFLLIIIAYYTVRDTVLYILIPYLIASSV